MTRARKPRPAGASSPARNRRSREDRSASLQLRLLGAHGAMVKVCGQSIDRLVRVRDGLAEQVRSLNELIEEVHERAELARERRGEVQAELKQDPPRPR